MSSHTFFHWRLVAFLFAAVTALGPVASAAQPGVDMRGETARIRQLATDMPQKALDRLETVRRLAGPDASYEVRQQLLRMEIWLRDDLGQQAAVYELERQSLQLAIAHGDAATAALARLGEVREKLNSKKLDEAQDLLDKVVAQAPSGVSLDFKVATARIQGDILNLRARFDGALAAYLRGLRVLQGVSGESGKRAMLYARIAHAYVNADNPKKAIEFADLGLAEKWMPLQVLAELQYTRGIASIRLGRDGEGIAAFDKALVASVRGGVMGTEAAIRGNIADYYLRQRDYVRAEQESRRALIVSDKVGKQSFIMMARANLGFALMGQGKFEEGLPYVDGVIAQMRKDKLTTDLELMLDEKGRMLERAGQYQRALAIVREQQSLQQQSARVARDRAIAKLQEEFDARRRSQQIVLLERENRLKDVALSKRRTVQIATMFAAVLTVLAGAVVYVMYRRAAKSNARLKELNVQLEFGSTHDALTGLHNRRSLTNRMTGRTEDGRTDRRDPARNHARGHAGAGVDCFILMDIDHFKNINDRWGHGAGDAVLVDVARRLATAVRDTDMVVRWGGEEFMIYAPGMDPDHVAGMAGRILEAVGAAPVVDGSCAIPVTLTAGIVALQPESGNACADAFDWQAAVRLADWALYQGKAHGRNQARIVTGLGAPVDTVLAALERDGDAVAALLVLDCVRGPRQAPERPAPAAVRGAQHEDIGGAAAAALRPVAGT